MLASVLLKWRGIRVGLWEPNAKMGLANRMIKKWVDECFLVFKDEDETLQKKSHLFGLPIRQELVSAALAVPPANPQQNYEPGAKLRVFIFGGSQGARGINQAILGLAEKESQFFRERLEVFHQTGKFDFEQVKASYEKLGHSVGTRLGDPLLVQPFVENMAEAYLWADFVICRSGASSVAEVALFQKPALFVPLPIAHDHQLENAKKLVEAGACLMVEQKNLTPEYLKGVLLGFLENPNQAQRMVTRLKDFRSPDSAQLIAKQVLSSILSK
jgi:UDP-N-acetylglucosamine--N-acetylmuramyl-(pentapeptide) pyrophosphoryl-undecaprenol N-acetylglucosamine transferase